LEALQQMMSECGLSCARCAINTHNMGSSETLAAENKKEKKRSKNMNPSDSKEWILTNQRGKS